MNDSRLDRSCSSSSAQSCNNCTALGCVWCGQTNGGCHEWFSPFGCVNPEPCESMIQCTRNNPEKITHVTSEVRFVDFAIVISTVLLVSLFWCFFYFGCLKTTNKLIQQKTIKDSNNHGRSSFIANVNQQSLLLLDPRNSEIYGDDDSDDDRDDNNDYYYRRDQPEVFTKEAFLSHSMNRKPNKQSKTEESDYVSFSTMNLMMDSPVLSPSSPSVMVSPNHSNDQNNNKHNNDHYHDFIKEEENMDYERMKEEQSRRNHDGWLLSPLQSINDDYVRKRRKTRKKNQSSINKDVDSSHKKRRMILCISFTFCIYLTLLCFLISGLMIMIYPITIPKYYICTTDTDWTNTIESFKHLSFQPSFNTLLTFENQNRIHITIDNPHLRLFYKGQILGQWNPPNDSLILAPRALTDRIINLKLNPSFNQMFTMIPEFENNSLFLDVVFTGQAKLKIAGMVIHTDHHNNQLTNISQVYDHYRIGATLEVDQSQCKCKNSSYPYNPF